MAHTRRSLQRALRGRARLDPRREIVLHHLTDGPARGWLHTHGLAAHGKPELEIRKVPRFLSGPAAGILNDLAEYLLNDAAVPLVPGDLVHLGRSTIRVLAARPDEDAGYDRAHYDGCIRLLLVDPPDAECACGECARKLAVGSRPPG
jgi:hypothetical protein